MGGVSGAVEEAREEEEVRLGREKEEGEEVEELGEEMGGVMWYRT